MLPSKLAIARTVVDAGRFRVCFTSEPDFSDVQLHAIDRATDLDALLVVTNRSARIVVALASLTESGPQVEFLNPPPPDVAKPLGAAFVLHIDCEYKRTLHSRGTAIPYLHTAVH